MRRSRGCSGEGNLRIFIELLNNPQALCARPDDAGDTAGEEARHSPCPPGPYSNREDLNTCLQHWRQAWLAQWKEFIFVLFLLEVLKELRHPSAWNVLLVLQWLTQPVEFVRPISSQMHPISEKLKQHAPENQGNSAMPTSSGDQEG